MKEGPSLTRHGRLRRLTDEEITLWLEVTRSITPRPGNAAPLSPRPPARPPVDSRPSKPVPAPPSPPPPAGMPRLAELDRRQRQRLARGQAAVDAAIDLHGMRQPEAHAALHQFLLRAQRDGAKVVLVVTGKGESRDETGLGTGVLRRGVPLWLNAPEWRSLVVGYEQASRLHGGAGALYVRVRRHERAAAGERAKR